MGRLLPYKSESTRSPDGPKVLDLDDEATEDALSALSSDTARQILATLYDEPKTPPEIRDQVGTSLQNVHYHVERLEDAELIQPAGEGYSEKGTEMTIYAPASEALVLFAGRERERSRLKTALTRLLGAVGVLAVASLALRRLFGESATRLRESADGTGDTGATGGSAGGDGGGAASATDAVSVAGDATATPIAEPTTPTATPDTSTPRATGTPTPEDEVGIFGGESTATDGGATATAQPTPRATATATPEPASSPTPAPEGTLTEVARDTQSSAETLSPTPGATGVESGATTPVPGTEAPTGTVEGARQVAGSGGDGLLTDPAVAFFFGGLFMILVVTAWWYWQG